MFKVKSGSKYYYISSNVDAYLHSNGDVLPCGEFWPTKERAQAVLARYQPARVWKHGDVFKNCAGRQMYCLHQGKEMVINFDFCGGGGGTPSTQLDGAIFLFNIKDKLPNVKAPQTSSQNSR